MIVVFEGLKKNTLLSSKSSGKKWVSESD